MTLRWLALFACVVYGSFVLYMYLKQRDLQYFPEDKGMTPQSVGLRDVDVLHLPTPDGETITAWYAGAPVSQPTILFFQGNGGEISDRAERFAVYQRARLRRSLPLLSRLWRQHRNADAAGIGHRCARRL